MATEWSSLDSMIKEAEAMQLSGQYINGRVFHALAAEVRGLRERLNAAALLMEESGNYILDVLRRYD